MNGIDDEEDSNKTLPSTDLFVLFNIFSDAAEIYLHYYFVLYTEKKKQK
jgi:hypothetical protein